MVVQHSGNPRFPGQICLFFGQIRGVFPKNSFARGSLIRRYPVLPQDSHLARTAAPNISCRQGRPNTLRRRTIPRVDRWLLKRIFPSRRLRFTAKSITGNFVSECFAVRKAAEERPLIRRTSDDFGGRDAMGPRPKGAITEIGWCNSKSDHMRGSCAVSDPWCGTFTTPPRTNPILFASNTTAPQPRWSSETASMSAPSKTEASSQSMLSTTEVSFGDPGIARRICSPAWGCICAT